MGNRNILIVFIDSLPFSIVNRMSFLSGARTLLQLTPGFGYSTNLLPELFSGHPPDDLGFFGEWGFAPQGSKFARIDWLLPLLEKLCFSFFSERVIRRLLREAIGPTANIPLRHLSYFKKEGISVYSPNFPYPTIFTQTTDLSLVLDAYEGPQRKRDKRGYLETKKQIQARNKIFLALPDLDSYGHMYGIKAPEYSHKLQELDRWLLDLHEAFLQRYPDGQIFVLSDHGMVNVEKGYHLQIEKEIGPSGKDSYAYFLDSTLLRIWMHKHDAKLQQSIHNYLNALPVGKLLSPNERERYGIRKRIFGDFIFILNEGIIFQPSSLSKTLPKAMHGYHPELASQKAVFAVFGACQYDNLHPKTNVDVAKTLMDLL
jgi:hypothetical protein